jgi:Family of unknown function (DUF6941)
MNVIPPKMDIKYVVVCDDARQEDNGKTILIGIYGEDYIVPRFPVGVSLCFWIRFEPTTTGEIELDFRLKGGDEIEFFTGKTKFAIHLKQLSGLPLKLPAVPIQAPIELALEIKQPGIDWQRVASINVKKGPMPQLQMLL